MGPRSVAAEPMYPPTTFLFFCVGVQLLLTLPLPASHHMDFLLTPGPAAPLAEPEGSMSACFGRAAAFLHEASSTTACTAGSSFARVSRDGEVPADEGESRFLFCSLGGGFVNIVPGGFGGSGPNTQGSLETLTTDGAMILALAFGLPTFFKSVGPTQANPLSPLSFQAGGPSIGLCTQFSGLSYKWQTSGRGSILLEGMPQQHPHPRGAYKVKM
jgi:hypothetical protein